MSNLLVNSKAISLFCDTTSPNAPPSTGVLLIWKSFTWAQIKKNMKGIWSFMADLNCFFFFLVKGRPTPPCPACLCCLMRAGRTLCANTQRHWWEIPSKKIPDLPTPLWAHSLVLPALLTAENKCFRILRIPGWRIFTSCWSKQLCLRMQNQKNI